MSVCFDGTTEGSGLTLDEWHALESPWESIEGQSPLMQLCRMVNKVRSDVLHLAPKSFHRVGSSTPDSNLADIDYVSNPMWNPFYDFSTILNECMADVRLFVNYSWPAFVTSHLGTDCYRRWFTDAVAMRVALEADLVGLNVQLQEDFQPIIVALRSALEALTTAELTTDPWVERTAIITRNNGESVSGHPEIVRGVYISGSGFSSQFVDNEQEFPPAGAWWVRFGGSENRNEYPGGTTCGGGSHTTPGPLGVEFQRGGMVYPWYSDSPFHTTGTLLYYFWEVGPPGVSPFCAATEVYSPTNGAPVAASQPWGGWMERNVCVKRFEIRRVLYEGGTPATHPTDGTGVAWTIEEFENGFQPISYTISNPSGSFSWAPGEYVKVVDVEFNMTDANTIGYWPDFFKHVDFQLVITTANPKYCQDACGIFHAP